MSSSRDPSKSPKPRTPPFGRLHVSCVRAELDASDAPRVALRVAYGSKQYETARARAVASRAYFDREPAAFDVALGEAAPPREIAVVAATATSDVAFGTLDVGAVLEGSVETLDAWVSLEGVGGGAGGRARVAVAFDVFEAPLEPGDAAVWSGLLEPARAWPAPRDAAFVVVAAAGDEVLAAYDAPAGPCRVPLRRAWLARDGSRAPTTLAAIKASPLGRALADAASRGRAVGLDARHRRRDLVSTEYPRRRGVAATSSPRNIHVVAAASPRPRLHGISTSSPRRRRDLVSTECPSFREDGVRPRTRSNRPQVRPDARGAARGRRPQ